MNDPVLALSAIAKTYHKDAANAVDVLMSVDLELRAGESVALVAPSGAGKSTLLHIAGLLDSADSGRVTLSGRDMTREGDRARTDARRNDIGFVYQAHYLLPEFSAAENVILPQLANGAAKTKAAERALELLASVGVDHRADHRPAELSGGEQQRVAFCRAMANSPRLLLADEPTGNLDPKTSDTVFDTLINLVRGQKMAALIATHNVELAARMDRIIHLDGGRIVQSK